jgi:hypothetical protein
MPENENPQKSCDLCQSKEPALEYDPHTPGHPHKRVNLCAECAKKNPTYAQCVTAQPEVVVPVIEPAVPETKEFAPATQPPIEIPKEPEMANKPKATENLAADVEKPPVMRQEIQKKIDIQKADLQKLATRRNELQQQLESCEREIIARRGAIAQMNDLLAIESDAS